MHAVAEANANSPVWEQAACAGLLATEHDGHFRDGAADQPRLHFPEHLQQHVLAGLRARLWFLLPAVALRRGKLVQAAHKEATALDLVEQRAERAARAAARAHPVCPVGAARPALLRRRLAVLPRRLLRRHQHQQLRRRNLLESGGTRARRGSSGADATVRAEEPVEELREGALARARPAGDHHRVPARPPFLVCGRAARLCLRHLLFVPGERPANLREEAARGRVLHLPVVLVAALTAATIAAATSSRLSSG